MAKQLEWHTEQRRVSDLHSWEKNPHVMNDTERQHLSNSIDKFDYVEVVIINTNNTIIGGHQRINDRMKAITASLGGEPDTIYCAVGSGTLLKGIIAGTTSARIVGVMVGAEYKDSVTDRVKLLRYSKGFEVDSNAVAPFPSCKNYDLKAWEYCMRDKPEGKVLFWNVF